MAKDTGCFGTHQHDTAEDSPCQAWACCSSQVCQVTQHAAAAQQHEADKGNEAVGDLLPAVCRPDECT